MGSALWISLACAYSALLVALGYRYGAQAVRGRHAPPTAGEEPRHDARGVRVAEPPANLTPEEIADLAFAGALPLVEPSGESIAIRYPYACEQYLAPWSPQSPLPDLLDFRLVKCHDISQGGISFFVPYSPTYVSFIITLGPAEARRFMAVKIVHSRAVFMYGEVGYLIGCRFMQRIDELGEGWQVEQAEAALV